MRIKSKITLRILTNPPNQFKILNTKTKSKILKFITFTQTLLWCHLDCSKLNWANGNRILTLICIFAHCGLITTHLFGYSGSNIAPTSSTSFSVNHCHYLDLWFLSLLFRMYFKVWCFFCFLLCIFQWRSVFPYLDHWRNLSPCHWSNFW